MTHKDLINSDEYKQVEKEMKSYKTQRRITVSFLFCAIIAIIFFSSCKPTELIRYVEIPKISVKIDSVLVQKTDSFIQFQKGDTIFQSRWRTVFNDRVKIEVDSIAVPYEVRVDVIKNVEVLKYRWFSYFDFSIVAILLSYLIFKLYNKFRV